MNQHKALQKKTRCGMPGVALFTSWSKLDAALITDGLPIGEYGAALFFRRLYGWNNFTGHVCKVSGAVLPESHQ